MAEERKWNSVNYDKAIAQAEAARNVETKWKGFYWVRGAMALICAMYFFIFPVIAVLFTSSMQIVIGYVDVFGIPLFGLEQEMLFWVKFGSGAEDAKVLVYDPVKNNIMLSIIGIFW